MKLLIFILVLPLLLSVPTQVQPKSSSGLLYTAGHTNYDQATYIPFYSNGYKILRVDGNRNKEYSIDSLPTAGYKYKLPVVADGPTLRIAGQSQESAVVMTYRFNKRKGYTTQTKISFGDSTARVINMKQLQSEAILLVWAKEIFSDTKSYIRFSYLKNNSWVTTEAEWDNLSQGMPWVSGDFAQDSTGGIWFFGQHDSNKNIAAIHLTDTGTNVIVDWVNPQFTYKDMGGLASEGENPYIVTEPYEDGIVLSYHSRDYKFFSTSSFLKGAKINITKVSPSGNHSLIYQTEDYAERITPFGLVGTSVIYAPIEGLEYAQRNNIYLLRQDGTKTFLGKSQYVMYFRYSDSSYFYNDLNGAIVEAGF